MADNLDELIEELERLRDAATPGPWSLVGLDQCTQIWQGIEIYVGQTRDYGGDDSALIVALRNNLPTIIAALKAAEWRPISEAKRDTLYQLFEPHDWGGFQFVGCMNTDGAWINNLDFCIQHPTHFKPLGPRPEGEG